MNVIFGQALRWDHNHHAKNKHVFDNFAGTKLGLPPQKLAILTAVASSAGFATPISYQTNLMVYGPGGYKFKDYLRIGLPLQFLTAIVALLALSILH